MTLSTRLSNIVVEAQAQALADLCDGGIMRIYSGPQPADALSGVGMDNVLLASVTLSTPAFSSVQYGVMTANAITPGVATDSGTASWFRIYKADGTAVVMDGSVGTTGSNLVLSSTTITTGVTIEITSFVHTLLKSHINV